MDDYETEHGRDYASFDEETFWFDIETEYHGVSHLVRGVHRETETDAIRGGYRLRKKQISKYEDEVVSEEDNRFEVLRRFQNAPELDQFDYYLDRADMLLDRAYELIQERSLTLEFVRLWTDLQKYHGFAIAHYLTSHDDQFSKRQGIKASIRREAQHKTKKIWAAKLILYHKALLEAQGVTTGIRTAANGRAVETIEKYIKAGGYKGRFTEKWFSSFLEKDRKDKKLTGNLSGSYVGGHLPDDELEEWASQKPDNKFPPLVFE